MGLRNPWAGEVGFLEQEPSDFLEDWEWSRSRSCRPQAWDLIQARLLAGERDDRVLMGLLTGGGPTPGWEVLRLTEALTAWRDYQDYAAGWAHYSASDLGGWLPHLGSPAHDKVWGRIRSWAASGRLRALQKELDDEGKSYLRLPDGLKEEWQREWAEGLAPYIEARLKRGNPLDQEPLPSPQEWTRRVMEADALVRGQRAVGLTSAQIRAWTALSVPGSGSLVKESRWAWWLSSAHADPLRIMIPEDPAHPLEDFGTGAGVSGYGVVLQVQEASDLAQLLIRCGLTDLAARLLVRFG